ncbi:MAG TPA: ABC transporter substrate-binding protein [Thermomicrobiales bacterium]|nr:ABC transporter substrate-binding protein [Thermomicrobiales bacterium]
MREHSASPAAALRRPLDSARSSRRTLLRGIAGAGVAAVGFDRLRAAAGDAARAQGAGGDLIIGYAQEQPTLDAPVPNSDSQSRLLNSVMDPLVWQPKSGSFEPGLAKSWDISDDSKQFTFHLRNDVKFHDGTPFNAAAVKFSFDRVADPALRALLVGLLGPYKQTDVVDEFTARVIFTEPYPLFLDSLSKTGIRPVSPTAVKKFGADFGQNIVSTGPFKLRSFAADSIVLERFADYAWGPAFLKHEGPAMLDTITYRIIPEDATRLTALDTGEVQFIDFTPPQEVDHLSGDGRYKVDLLYVPGLPQMLQLNVTKAPTSDKAVRQAMQYAINHQAIVDVIWFGKAKPAYGVMSSTTPGYWPGVKDVYPYDPDRARQILEQDGWKVGPDGVRVKDGQRLEISYITNTSQAPTAEIIQAMLADVGIAMTVEALSSQASLARYQDNDYNVGRLGEITNDPSVMCFPVDSVNITGGTQGNRSRYSNPKVDALCDQAARETDWNKRAALYEQLQKIVADDAIIIGAYEQVLINTRDVTVTDMQYDPVGRPFFLVTQLAAQ